MSTHLRKLLAELKRGLIRIYGENLDRIILYGSQARGDAAPDSDIDILVVLKYDFDYGEMLDLSSELVASLSLEKDLVISRAFVSRAEYEQKQSPFLMNVRREGIAV